MASHPRAPGRGDAAHGSRLAGCPAHSSGGVTPSAAARAADWFRGAPYGGRRRYSREPPHTSLEPRERSAFTKPLGRGVELGQPTAIAPLDALGAGVTDVDRPWSGPEPTLPTLQEQHLLPPHLPSPEMRPNASSLGYADSLAANLQADFGLVKGAKWASARSRCLCSKGTARAGHPSRPASASHCLRTPRREGVEECAASRAAHLGSLQAASARPVDPRPGRGSRRFLRVRP